MTGLEGQGVVVGNMIRDAVDEREFGIRLRRLLDSLLFVTEKHWWFSNKERRELICTSYR